MKDNRLSGRVYAIQISELSDNGRIAVVRIMQHPGFDMIPYPDHSISGPISSPIRFDPNFCHPNHQSVRLFLKSDDSNRAGEKLDNVIRVGPRSYLHLD